MHYAICSRYITEMTHKRSTVSNRTVATQRIQQSNAITKIITQQRKQHGYRFGISHVYRNVIKFEKSLWKQLLLLSVYSGNPKAMFATVRLDTGCSGACVSGTGQASFDIKSPIRKPDYTGKIY